MIEINDLSSDTGGSLPECSIGDKKYDTSNIKVFLKNQPEKYTLVDNRRVNAVKSSPCWTRFARPAVKDEIIKNYNTQQ